MSTKNVYVIRSNPFVKHPALKRPKGMRILKYLELKEEWFSHGGYLTNFPFGQRLSEFGVYEPATVAVSSYIGSRQFLNTTGRPDDEMVLKVEIHADRIYQEIPHGRIAEIFPGMIRIYLGTMGNIGQLQEIWKSSISNGIDLQVHWRCVERRIMQSYGPSTYNLPSTLGGVAGHMGSLLHMYRNRWQGLNVDWAALEAIWKLTPTITDHLDILKPEEREECIRLDRQHLRYWASCFAPSNAVIDASHALIHALEALNKVWADGTYDRGFHTETLTAEQRVPLEKQIAEYIELLTTTLTSYVEKVDRHDSKLIRDRMDAAENDTLHEMHPKRTLPRVRFEDMHYSEITSEQEDIFDIDEDEASPIQYEWDEPRLIDNLAV